MQSNRRYVVGSEADGRWLVVLTASDQNPQVIYLPSDEITVRIGPDPTDAQKAELETYGFTFAQPSSASGGGPDAPITPIPSSCPAGWLTETGRIDRRAATTTTTIG